MPEIRVYSPEGIILRCIGRRGGGPGEFERAPRFGVSGDTVWAVDNRRNRITLFDREVIARSLRAEIDFPKFQMPIQYPWAARDGSIWLRWQDVDNSTARWIPLDVQGRPRGELRLPADIQIQWSRGDTFWAVDPDEYDVPWLVRFTIQPG